MNCFDGTISACQRPLKPFSVQRIRQTSMIYLLGDSASRGVVYGIVVYADYVLATSVGQSTQGTASVLDWSTLLSVTLSTTRRLLCISISFNESGSVLAN